MSKKTEVFKSHHAIVELSRKISELASDQEGIKDRGAIAALAQAIETEAWVSLKLTKEILEENEFDDLGPTE
jgi:predicted  nucleic acid-binding Zn-ribbon protein